MDRKSIKERKKGKRKGKEQRWKTKLRKERKKIEQ
jgi:hypothetical protein